MTENKFRNRTALMGALCLLVVAMEGKDGFTVFALIAFSVVLIVMSIFAHKYPEYFQEEEEK